jgi:hypothetical protein
VDTENLSDPFAQVDANGKVILGGRALKLLSDQPLKENGACV